MKTVEIHPIQESQALLVGWLHPYYEEMAHRKKRPCAVICPGGAYKYCSDREADPIAEAYFAKGFQVFILYYSTTGRELERPATGLRPLGELSESVVLSVKTAPFTAWIRKKSQSSAFPQGPIWRGAWASTGTVKNCGNFILQSLGKTAPTPWSSAIP